MPSPNHEAMIQEFLPRLLADPADGVEGQRRALEEAMSSLPVPPSVKIEETTVGGVAAEWVHSVDAMPGRVVLYLHGGGYVSGSPRAYRNLAARLASATGSRVLVPDYRLAPEHPFPAALDDALAVYRQLLAAGFDPARAAVAGDSAGGGLGLATLVALRDAGTPLPSAGVFLSPLTDLEGTGASAAPGAVDDPFATPGSIQAVGQMYAPRDLRNPLAAPLYADFSGLPDLLIFVGTREALLDDARRVARKASGQGVAVQLEIGEGLVHVWPVLAPDAPESIEAISKIARFLGERLSEDASASPRGAGPE